MKYREREARTRATRGGAAALAAALGLLATIAGGAVVHALAGEEGPARALALVAAAVSVASLTWLVVRISHDRRLFRLASFLDEQALAQDGLRRLPPLGDDAIGRAACAVNTLLASTTNVRVSMIDQSFELREKARELELTLALADKSSELEQRLGERRLLFDLLRTSAEKTGLDEVLSTIAARLGPALRLRELALFVRDGDGFVVRAVHGFTDPSAVMGRAIARGEGVASDAIERGEPVVVRDVSVDPDYLAFWDLAPRVGSFAAVPIRHVDEHLGLLALTRPVEDPLTEVEVRLLSAIADTVSLVIRHARLVDELEQLSTHDPLTGVANRRLFDSQLAREIDRAARYETDLSIVTVDVDHFKQLNDTFGHAAGDVVLRAVADALSRHVRSVDTVARIGGEEFVVVLPRTDLARAERVAEKIRACVAALELEIIAGRRVTVSMGVAQHRAGEAGTDLLSRADVALYAAKQSGRDRVASSGAAA